MTTIPLQIEFMLRSIDESTVSVDVSIQASWSNSRPVIAHNELIKFDLNELASNAWNPDHYGDKLTQTFFKPQPLRDAWIKAKAQAEVIGCPIRIRLRIDPQSYYLHTLRWETLRDPDSQSPLSSSRRMLLSRYLDSSDLSRVPIIPRSELRALVLIGNPADIQTTYGLQPLAVAGEAERIRVALTDISVCFLSNEIGNKKGSLNSLISELENNYYPIVYFMCHGNIENDDAILYIEKDDGECDPVSGTMLEQLITDLSPDHRPLLIVMAVCRSAGNGSDYITGALAPRLARAGVAAVIGMQGDVPIAIIEQMMPRFFEALAEDGTVDRALALARASLTKDDAWWMPILYLRANDGRIWQAKQGDVQVASTGLHALHELMQQRIELRVMLANYHANFGMTHNQVKIIATYKLLHDLWQQLESFVRLLHLAARRLTDSEEAWEDLELHEIETRRLIERLLGVANQFSLKAEESVWMRRLEHRRDELRRSIKQFDGDLLRKVLSQFDALLSAQLMRVNSELVASVGTLRLVTLVGILSEAHRRLLLLNHPADLDNSLGRLTSGIEALEHLAQQLDNQVRAHNLFQVLDHELRGVRSQIEHQPQELDDVWSDLEPIITQLIALEEHRYKNLSESARALQESLTVGDMLKIRHFKRFIIQVSTSFNQADHQLLTLCNDLQTIGEPLRQIVMWFEER
ncbi:CHAT domain-containing protein [Candidatus Chloroploca sp. Khr17]|uniref:CHAT domain-containing protein n=1 Tax=Candidatus Chloroploca sp. Khr17 TaxID=2496869 RepID=UPI00101C8120|nr:CHAT domain-containing protein [Candidatus Chloroploca sp. Khr17]